MLIVICEKCRGLKHLSGSKAEAREMMEGKKRCECPPDPPAPQPHGPPHPDAIICRPRKIDTLYEV